MTSNLISSCFFLKHAIFSRHFINLRKLISNRIPKTYERATGVESTMKQCAIIHKYTVTSLEFFNTVFNELYFSYYFL